MDTKKNVQKSVEASPKPKKEKSYGVDCQVEGCDQPVAPGQNAVCVAHQRRN